MRKKADHDLHPKVFAVHRKENNSARKRKWSKCNLENLEPNRSFNSISVCSEIQDKKENTEVPLIRELVC